MARHELRCPVHAHQNAVSSTIVEVAAALSTLGAGLIGIILGALLARRNEKRAQGERLLVEALNDAATAIAEVAGGEGKSAQNRYASAMSRIALHASPRVVSQFREFQNDPTTATQDGRTRLINAVQQARLELGHGKASDEDLAVLLFGDVKPDKRFFAQCDTWLSAMDFPTRLAIEREADRAAQSLKSTMQEKSDR